ncbi:MAG: hypothetical protein BWK73_37470 [Thiothrix lacustris]|uniref:Uncharacterized protein n=1 Tax=Thiothrix lacustris TaxID=525917 RepID=A0A1Y1QFG1_9GAMM|nr:MAG: hypothetical protein BWK73_37470 [Thiothrix lacustris]
MSNEVIKRLQEIQCEINNKEVEISRLRSEHISLKQSLKMRGCECESNHCKTEKIRSNIKSGDKDDFCHDDQDYGRVFVKCEAGEIKVTLGANVHDYDIGSADWTDDRTLGEGDVWEARIPAQSDWLDQTNIVDILAIKDSIYNLQFESWDK